MVTASAPPGRLTQWPHRCRVVVVDPCGCDESETRAEKTSQGTSRDTSQTTGGAPQSGRQAQENSTQFNSLLRKPSKDGGVRYLLRAHRVNGARVMEPVELDTALMLVWDSE